MEFENRFNYPPEIVSVLSRDYYNKDEDGRETDYSATTLVAPIQQTVLRRRHPEKLRIFDVADRFWAFVGSIAHKVLEEHGHDESLIEKRFYAEVLGKVVSGQVDVYRDGAITDYKSTKSYKIIRGDFGEWEKQLNIYAFLAWLAGLKVDRIRVFAFILDWKKAEAYKRGYPESPIVEIRLPLWNPCEQEAYIQRRVSLLIENEALPDEALLPCSEKEQWRDVKDFAVLKEGGRRAVKCYDSWEEAQRHALKPGERIEKRFTERKRCYDHCDAAPLCRQHLKLAKAEGREPSQDACIF